MYLHSVNDSTDANTTYNMPEDPDTDCGYATIPADDQSITSSIVPNPLETPTALSEGVYEEPIKIKKEQLIILHLK